MTADKETLKPANKTFPSILWLPVPLRSNQPLLNLSRIPIVLFLLSTGSVILAWRQTKSKTPSEQCSHTIPMATYSTKRYPLAGDGSEMQNRCATILRRRHLTITDAVSLQNRHRHAWEILTATGDISGSTRPAASGREILAAKTGHSATVWRVGGWVGSCSTERHAIRGQGRAWSFKTGSLRVINELGNPIQRSNPNNVRLISWNSTEEFAIGRDHCQRALQVKLCNAVQLTGIVAGTLTIQWP